MEGALGVVCCRFAWCRALSHGAKLFSGRKCLECLVDCNAFAWPLHSTAILKQAHHHPHLPLRLSVPIDFTNYFEANRSMPNPLQNAWDFLYSCQPCEDHIAAWSIHLLQPRRSFPAQHRCPCAARKAAARLSPPPPRGRAARPGHPPALSCCATAGAASTCSVPTSRGPGQSTVSASAAHRRRVACIVAQGEGRQHRWGTQKRASNTASKPAILERNRGGGGE